MKQPPITGVFFLNFPDYIRRDSDGASEDGEDCQDQEKCYG